MGGLDGGHGCPSARGLRVRRARSVRHRTLCGAPSRRPGNRTAPERRASDDHIVWFDTERGHSTLKGLSPVHYRAQALATWVSTQPVQLSGTSAVPRPSQGARGWGGATRAARA
ncbi:IS3 family transposase [Nocardiopsis sp. B62]|uniref:IS3 family transposase n=1 Tax=Nocardiopsis sp. B62 TaxID=2824874 RepID=UPI0035B0D920